jgi:predicted RND superfamily exporter protein
MIPIFLMSIAMVDSIHVISEFFDVYTGEKGRKETIKEVMHTLFVPVLYTSLTTAAGFASLTFTPIPPARVFGAFLSIGVMIAWLYTVIFAPAYIMMIPGRRFENFGLSAREEERDTWLTRTLRAFGGLTYNRAKPLLGLLVVLVAGAIWGTTQIRVNDNYAKRFVKSHPIRKADIALNNHLDGTYTAYLVLEGKKPGGLSQREAREISRGLVAFAHRIKGEFKDAPELAKGIAETIPGLAAGSSSREDLLDAIASHIDRRCENASDDDFYAYDELRTYIGVEKERLKVFKRPEVLGYMAALQRHMEETGVVGKSTSLADAVSKVNQEMIDGRPESFRIPDRLEGVAECCFQFQQGHRPGDLWHMVTPDYMSANIWMQLKSGDSSDMKSAVVAVDEYFRENPPPADLTHRWAGLHYINLVLEDNLIPAMLRSFLGSFLVVFIMMSFLFRSLRWGLLCMAPLTITIVVIYGIIGIFGVDYDLPIAVLGVLALGIAVDFAIHFLERSRAMYREEPSWKDASQKMFGEPARAISRNVLVVAIGFLPLLAAPLVPYKTTGIMLFAILSLSGVITLLVLPAVLRVAEGRFFRSVKEPGSGKLKSQTTLPGTGH